MTTQTATLEREDDGTWTAYLQLGDGLVMGEGDTMDEAKADLRAGIDRLIQYLKEEGNPVPESHTDELSFEVIGHA